MKKPEKDQGPVELRASFTVHRPPPDKPFVIYGAVSADVRDGALLIFKGSELIHAFAPGYWRTVNVE